MSMPWWYEQAHAPCMRPLLVGVLRKTERGSPKLPRTGCCWSKGLTGQPYDCDRCVEDAEAGVAAVEFCMGRAVLPARAPPPIAATRRNIVAKRRCAPRWICVLVAMRPPSKGVAIGPSARPNGPLTRGISSRLVAWGRLRPAPIHAGETVLQPLHA